MSVSLSSDVECTMTADMFTQMRGVLTLQRMLANELALQGKEYPKLMSSLEALKLATIGGAKGLKIDRVTGSLTPGKDADIVLLDAEALNVAPLNNAVGAIVTLMDRLQRLDCALRRRRQEMERRAHWPRRAETSRRIGGEPRLRVREGGDRPEPVQSVRISASRAAGAGQGRPTLALGARRRRLLR